MPSLSALLASTADSWGVENQGRSGCKDWSASSLSRLRRNGGNVVYKLKSKEKSDGRGEMTVMGEGATPGDAVVAKASQDDDKRCSFPPPPGKGCNDVGLAKDMQHHKSIAAMPVKNNKEVRGSSPISALPLSVAMTFCAKAAVPGLSMSWAFFVNYCAVYLYISFREKEKGATSGDLLSNKKEKNNFT